MALQAANGKVLSVAGSESVVLKDLAGAKPGNAESFQWVNLMRGDTMLMSLTNHQYLATKPNSPGLVMANALGFELEALGPAALVADEGVKVSSMCTVFAESEVTGLVHRGEDRGRISRGLHESIARRTMSTLGRVRASAPLVFAGGVANNAAMVELTRAGFAGEVIVPECAQTVGALGAALSAMEPMPSETRAQTAGRAAPRAVSGVGG